MSEELEQRRGRIRLESPASSARELVEELREAVRHRRLWGCVVAVSGGIDSSCCLALAVEALGPQRVLALSMPDKDSSPVSPQYAERLAAGLGTDYEKYDITHVLEALQCYELQTSAIREVVPDYSQSSGRFLVEYEEDFADSESIPSFNLVAEINERRERIPLPPSAWLGIVAATNLKQRARMAITHLRAEQRNYAVVGTSNRLELEQGFFVRYGEATGDCFPLRRLLKQQVYDLATALPGIPEDIMSRTPTTDTYSLEQSQETFFFGLPVELNDLLWDAFSSREDPTLVASELALDGAYVAKVFAAFARRRQLAARLGWEGLALADGLSED